MFFSKEIQIRDRVIIENMESPYIIAEMACSHDGDVQKAKTLVDFAVSGGADAIQFEIFNPDDNIVPQEEVHSLLRRLFFAKDQWKELYGYARQFDIAISTFAYDYPSLELGLELGSDILKLNSSDLSNPKMVKECCRSGLPFTVGTGSSTMEEVSKTVNLCLENGGTKVILMHGLQNFPTDFKNAHIRKLLILKNTFDCLVGSADHTDASLEISKIVDLMAIGIGASVLEKHITVDRKEKGVDHESALEPTEFKQYVKLMKTSYIAMGPPRIMPLKENDFRYRKFQKKSIVAIRDIKPDEKLSRSHFAFLRNSKSSGISPMEFNKIIGKKTRNPIRKHDQITYNDLCF